MDNNIKRVVLSVVITTVIVLLSIPLWIYSSSKGSTIMANSYGDLNVSVDVGKFESLVVIEDERAMDFITPTEVSLRNRNESEKEFEFVLLINKESTVPSKFIRVSIDDEVYKLNEMKQEEDEDNYYYVLQDEQLDAYSEVVKNVRLWLSEDASGLSDSSTLKTNFVTR